MREREEYGNRERRGERGEMRWSRGGKGEGERAVRERGKEGEGGEGEMRGGAMRENGWYWGRWEKLREV